MSRTERQIWQVTTKIPNGQLQVYRSQKVGDAIRLDEVDKLIQTGETEIIVPATEDRSAVIIHKRIPTGQKIRNGVMAIWITLQLLENQTQNTRRFVPGRLPSEVWALISSFSIGDNNPDIDASLNAVANYALCLKDRPITRGIFPIVFHPDVLVQAVLHGDETMVRNILKTNPDLLKVGTGIDFSGRKFKGTPLAASIATNDFAPNKSSTGLCDLIAAQLTPQHFEKHTRIIYKKSLRVYLRKLEAKIMALEEAKSSGRPIDENELNNTILRAQAYSVALSSNDLITIINAHTAQDEATPDAQKDNVLQVDPALINAIANASDTDIQAIVNDSTINSPLNILLRQFKADFIKLSHEEIIYNPQHLLKIFALYSTFITCVVATDQSWMKRDFFWDNLVEFVMCYLPANTAQIFANPGLYDTVENNAKNIRSFDFEYGGGRIFPPVVSPLDPLNIKLRAWRAGGLGVAGGRLGRVSCAELRRNVSKLMSSKNSKLSELIAQPLRARARKSQCVVS